MTPESPYEKAISAFDDLEFRTGILAGGGAGSPPPPSPPLSQGGGDGTFDGMETRVTRLEEQMAGVRKDLGEIKDSLRVLPTLPTKADLNTWRWQWIATGVAIVALTVGGITGGLALINKTSAPFMAPTPSAPPPIIIQLPSNPSPPAPLHR